MTDQTQLLRDAQKLIAWHEAHSNNAKSCALFNCRKDLQEIATGHENAATTIRNLINALSAPAQPASGDAFDWPDRAVLSVMNQVGDGPYGEDDVKVTRHFLKIADEVRTQFTTPASQEQGGSVVLVGERVRAMHRECATMDLHERCHECQAYASQEQAKWCEYVAGMVWQWLHDSGAIRWEEDRCTKAIAGIIERRLWVLKREASQEQAQPSGEVVCVAIDHLNNPQRDGFTCNVFPAVEIGTKLYTAPQPAQPAARVAMTDEQVLVLRFLLGIGLIDGCAYGDTHPDMPGRFWWRKSLREAFGITSNGEA
jgi:hypothetical protein